MVGAVKVYRSMQILAADAASRGDMAVDLYETYQKSIFRMSNEYLFVLLHEIVRQLRN